MISTSLATYFSLFKFAYKRDSGMGKVTHAAFILTALAGLIFAWKMPDYAQSGYLLSIISFAGLLVGYWLVFCIGFLLQNSPANACTVPHLHLRIRRLSLSLGLLMSVFFSTYAVWIMSLFLSPLFFVHVLRDYSEISQDTVNEMGVAGIALMIIIACFSLKLGEGDFFYGSVATVALLVLFTVYLGVNRWRRMLSYSFQLPVGHRKN